VTDPSAEAIEKAGISYGPAAQAAKGTLNSLLRQQGKPMTNMRPQLSSIELERLLEGEGYLWNDWIRAYQRVRDVWRETTEEYLGRSPALVTLEELEDNNCTKPDATLQERTAGYAWLKKRLSRTRLRQLSHRPR
jgi:hypothetical protein